MSSDYYKAMRDGGFAMAREDARLNMLIDSTVTDAMRNVADFEPRRWQGVMHGALLEACTVLAKRIFDNDAEISALRYERDRYKELATKALTMAPMPPIVLPANADVEQQKKA